MELQLPAARRAGSRSERTNGALAISTLALRDVAGRTSSSGLTSSMGSSSSSDLGSSVVAKSAIFGCWRAGRLLARDARRLLKSENWDAGPRRGLSSLLGTFKVVRCSLLDDKCLSACSAIKTIYWRPMREHLVIH